MAEPRLSKILIGALLVGLFSLSFMLFLSNGAEEYNVEGYTNSSLQAFTTTSNDIQDISNESLTKLDGAGAGASSDFDIFGSFFSNSWTALKSTWSSITTLSNLGTQAVNEIPVINSAFRNQLKAVITSIIVIIFVIGIFFHFIKNSNRL